jgi:CBS domain-containing protein
MKEFPFLEHEIQEAFDVCTVSDVMTSPVLTLNGVEKASVIEQMLLKSPHNAFPVLDQDTKQYVGIIRRDQLVALIECGIYLEELDESQQKRTQSVRAREVMTRAATQHLGRALMEDADSYTSVHMTVRTTANILDKESEWLKDNVVRSDHGKSVVISTDETLPGGNAVTRITGTRVDVDPRGNIVVRVCTHERNSHVDIAAAMNKGAFTVTQNCPLSKAYGLFTSMGLRHLPVLGPDGKVIGLLTRSNFSPGHLERRTGLSFHH